MPILKKVKRVVKPGISVCSRITRLMNNQTKSQRKAANSHKRRESDDKNAVAILKIVPQLGCVSQDSDALVSQRGKQPRGNPMQKVSGPSQRVRFTKSTLRHASIRDKKGPSLGKRQVANPHQRSPYAMKFEDRSHEETERQERCTRSKAWNLAKNIYKLKEKDKATSHSPAEEWVLPAASTKEPEERKFALDSGASMHLVSKRDLNSAELETMRTSRSPTTRPTARCKPEKKRRYTSKNWTYSSKLCFLKKLPQFFPWGNSVRIMGIHTTGSAVKNHVSSEKAKDLFATYRTMYHLWFLVYQGVLPQLHFHLLLHHLHHRIPYLMSTDTPKIQYQNEVEVRVESFGKPVA